MEIYIQLSKVAQAPSIDGANSSALL